MKRTKQFLALCLVLALIGIGGILLMLDYDTNAAKWVAIIAAVISFAAGLSIGYVLDRKHLLPE